jgi:hypothetical protein
MTNSTREPPKTAAQRPQNCRTCGWRAQVSQSEGGAFGLADLAGPGFVIGPALAVAAVMAGAADPRGPRLAAGCGPAAARTGRTVLRANLTRPRGRACPGRGAAGLRSPGPAAAATVAAGFGVASVATGTARLRAAGVAVAGVAAAGLVAGVR